MNDEADFLPILKGQIMAQGVDEATAGHYAALVGDTPITDRQGHLLVMEHGKILATLKMVEMFQA